ncbi:MAG: SCO family protein [Pirellulales bacterium]|nr:SCO family protein [Pirellulales bacterium]
MPHPTVVILIALLFLLVGTSGVRAQVAGDLPKEVQGVEVIEHLGDQIPLDLEFVDSQGKKVTLGQLVNGKKPIILTLNYSDCPMLCVEQLNGLFDALEKMEWNIGDQYDMVTVSIDPLETTERARMTKQKYLKRYGRAGAAAGYHMLTGREENIKKLANAVGFHYTYSPDTKQYNHAAVTMILMPDGRVARYLYGVMYDPQTVRLSLYEAAEGKVGSTVDKVLMFCFQYDPEKGRYGLASVRLMQAGGALTLVVLGSAIWIFRRREKKKAKGSDQGDANASSESNAPSPPAPLPKGEGS